MGYTRGTRSNRSILPRQAKTWRFSAPYCPSPSCMAELQGSRTQLWCPNCETHYYIDGNVEYARNIVRAKFNAEILQ